MLSDKAKAEIKAVMGEYPDPRSAIMPALYVAQREVGWLPDEALDDIAQLFGMTRTEVGSVASFYTMYYRQPVGRHMVHVCTDLPCALAGADEMYAAMRAKLGLKDGDTTDDGAITLREAECLGGCNHAVVALVDGAEHLEDLTAEKIDVLIARLRK